MSTLQDIEADQRVLAHRVGAIEDTVREALVEIRDGITEIARNTGKLAILEERHAETRDGLGRAFGEIAEVRRQLAVVQVAMPGLLELRRMVMTGILGVLGIVGIGLMSIIIIIPR